MFISISSKSYNEKQILYALSKFCDPSFMIYSGVNVQKLTFEPVSDGNLCVFNRTRHTFYYEYTQSLIWYYKNIKAPNVVTYDYFDLKFNSPEYKDIHLPCANYLYPKVLVEACEPGNRINFTTEKQVVKINVDTKTHINLTLTTQEKSLIESNIVSDDNPLSLMRAYMEMQNITMINKIVNIQEYFMWLLSCYIYNKLY